MYAFNTHNYFVCVESGIIIFGLFLSNTMQISMSAQRDVTTVTRPVPTLSAPSPAHVGVDTH